MDIKELRIGNLVLDREGKIGVVCEVCDCLGAGFVKFENDLQLTSIQYVEPIPLTEECLKKFGISNIWVFEIFGDDSRGFHISYPYGEWIFIKYVHELQNLYFALVGEELEIKNPTWLE